MKKREGHKASTVLSRPSCPVFTSGLQGEAASDFLSPELLLGALLIFGMRIIDVALDTLRIGMLVRGKHRWAGLLSFFESLIWLIAAAKVLGTLENPVQFVAYAGGYATGTMLGANIERWLAVGQVVVRIHRAGGRPGRAKAPAGRRVLCDRGERLGPRR